MSVKLRQKKLKDGRISLYLDIYHKGKRNYEFLELYIKKAKTSNDRRYNQEITQMAETIRNQRDLQLSSSDYDFMPKNRSKVSFIDYMRALGQSKDKPNTRANFEKGIRHICLYSKREELSFEDITEEWLWGYRAYLLENLGQNTASQYFSQVVQALKKGTKERIIVRDASVNVKKIPQKSTLKEFLTIEELRTLYETECKLPVVKSTFLFACLTGLRKSDVIQLRWKNIREADKIGYFISLIQEKTNSPVQIPISKQAQDLMGEKKGPDEKVFPGFNDNNWYHHNLKIWVARAGITKSISFHNARHTFATLTQTYNGDIYTTQALLGHSKPTMTQIYAKVVDQKRRDAVDSIPDIRKKEELGGSE